MQRHWKAFVLLGLALVAYIAVMMFASYFMAVAIMLIALFGTGAYLIAIAHFKDRSDGPDREEEENPLSAHGYGFRRR
jgi:hypothetical protein